MLRICGYLVFWGYMALTLGCGDGSPNGDDEDTDTETNTEGETDPDNELDAGGDGDTDTDADTDADADTDTDADAGGDTDTDADGGSEYDIDKEWTPDFDTDPGEDQSEDTWTIMMYEDADNNLENVLLDDVNEMEKATIPDNVNVIVLIDRTPGHDASDGNWKGAKLFKIAHDETAKQINSPRLADPDFLGLTADSENGEEIDMGASETLSGFIDFCKKAFPADHYILHMSDHGDGWKYELGVNVELPGPVRATCSDDSSGNSLSMSEDLPSAIEGKGLDAVTLDACSLGTVEVAWALAPHTRYTALSVMTVPGTGWAYKETLDSWFEHMSAKNWVLTAVEEYKNYYTGQPGVGFTALDLSKIGEFKDAFDDFVAIIGNAAVEEIVKIRNKTYRPDRLTGLSMRDLTNFVRRVEVYVGHDTVDEVLSSYEDIILSYWHTNSLKKLKGLTIYAPGPGLLQGGPYMKVYNNTPFARDTGWDEFVRSLL